MVSRLARAVHKLAVSPAAPDAVAWLVWLVIAAVIVAAWF